MKGLSFFTRPLCCNFLPSPGNTPLFFLTWQQGYDNFVPIPSFQITTGKTTCRTAADLIGTLLAETTVLRIPGGLIIPRRKRDPGRNGP